jgi:hypothetical protein
VLREGHGGFGGRLETDQEQSRQGAPVRPNQEHRQAGPRLRCLRRGRKAGAQYFPNGPMTSGHQVPTGGWNYGCGPPGNAGDRADSSRAATPAATSRGASRAGRPPAARSESPAHSGPRTRASAPRSRVLRPPPRQVPASARGGRSARGSRPVPPCSPAPALPRAPGQ